MGYYLDLDNWALKSFKETLKKADLLPSRRMLQKGTDKAFAAIARQGVGTVGGLLDATKTKTFLQEFVAKSEIDEAYLAVLIRELKGYRRKPNKLKDFPETPANVVSGLEELGIKTTLQLYERVLTERDRHALAQEASVTPEEILRLAKLADLSRIRWVNHTFAYVLYEAGYDTAQKVAEADHEALHADITAINKARGFYKGNIGVHDVKLCVESAREFPADISFD